MHDYHYNATVSSVNKNIEKKPPEATNNKPNKLHRLLIQIDFKLIKIHSFITRNCSIKFIHMGNTARDNNFEEE